jgi:predicted ATPase
LLVATLEEGALVQDWGRCAVVPSLERLGLPETVRQLITRRLRRLSEPAAQLLRVAAAFSGGVDFEVARRVADLDEARAFDALDEVLGVQLLAAKPDAAAYDFTRALAGASAGRSAACSRDSICLREPSLPRTPSG